MYRQRPYLVCTVYVLWCTYGYTYIFTILPNVYLYYYICYYTTDVTTLMVNLTVVIFKSEIWPKLRSNLVRSFCNSSSEHHISQLYSTQTWRRADEFTDWLWIMWTHTAIKLLMRLRHLSFTDVQFGLFVSLWDAGKIASRKVRAAFSEWSLQLIAFKNETFVQQIQSSEVVGQKVGLVFRRLH